MTYRFLLMLVIFSCCSAVASAGITVSPLELTIAMEDEFLSGDTGMKITVYNAGDQDVNVTWYIEHPNPPSYMRANKTTMPNLSWIDVEPSWIVLQPHRSARFSIFTDIPDRTDLYDQHWEVWVTFKSGKQGMFAFEHAVRVYIDTPAESEPDGTLPGATDTVIVPVAFVALVAGILIGIVVVMRSRWRHTRGDNSIEKNASAENRSSTEARIDETLSSFEQRKK